MSDTYNNQNYDKIEETDDLESEKEKKEDTQKYLTFLSNHLTFGVNAAYVSEIITNHHITVLPMVPSYVKGIINLRGQIIPILDIRDRMRKPPMENTEEACIIVLEVDTVFIGIYVDTVSQVIDVKSSEISAMPSNNSQELVNGMMSLSDHTVVLFLDCELLIQN